MRLFLSFVTADNTTVNISAHICWCTRRRFLSWSLELPSSRRCPSPALLGLDTAKCSLKWLSSVFHMYLLIINCQHTNTAEWCCHVKLKHHVMTPFVQNPAMSPHFTTNGLQSPNWSYTPVIISLALCYLSHVLLLKHIRFLPASCLCSSCLLCLISISSLLKLYPDSEA